MKEKDLSCFGRVFAASSVLGRLLASRTLAVILFQIFVHPLVCKCVMFWSHRICLPFFFLLLSCIFPIDVSFQIVSLAFIMRAALYYIALISAM